MFPVSLLFAATLAAQASGQTSPAGEVATPQTGPVAQTTAQERPRRVCERRALTGRRLEQTICYTPEQYAALVEAKRKELREIQSRDAVQYDRSIVGIPPGPL
ncbi:MAG: hypothetical protein ACJAVC_000978 [Brevundimonas sp.]|uniref:hypothetical protein n=1 Tax=Brevundimonas TaxID=41275 RepID=UPI000B0D9160|nr:MULTISPECIES: hypothetical protein [Brevundimonas]MEA3473962.1 hypothetical protein [Pseudomonadota bacterium]NSX33686.1 hypothetical protein [Brevundimonas vesicularis]QIF80701.1 hypothetical protein E4341_02835 [Brevundimonas sp. 'scallop']